MGLDPVNQDSIVRLAAHYAALKRELAVRHGNDRVAYTEAKTDFIRAIEAHATAGDCPAGSR